MPIVKFLAYKFMGGSLGFYGVNGGVKRMGL